LNAGSNVANKPDWSTLLVVAILKIRGAAVDEQPQNTTRIVAAATRVPRRIL
jgi:hypothetical protein